MAQGAASGPAPALVAAEKCHAAEWAAVPGPEPAWEVPGAGQAADAAALAGVSKVVAPEQADWVEKAAWRLALADADADAGPGKRPKLQAAAGPCLASKMTAHHPAVSHWPGSQACAAEPQLADRRSPSPGWSSFSPPSPVQQSSDRDLHACQLKEHRLTQRTPAPSVRTSSFAATSKKSVKWT